jgi:hypothetical protein
VFRSIVHNTSSSVKQIADKFSARGGAGKGGTLWLSVISLFCTNSVIVSFIGLVRVAIFFPQLKM